MSEQPIRDSWRAACAALDDVVGPNWSHIPAFRELVEQLGALPEASALAAIVSHDTLIVSRFPDNQDAIEGRHARLRPLPDGRVQIETHAAGWKSPAVEKRLVASTEAFAAVQEVLRWL